MNKVSLNQTTSLDSKQFLFDFISKKKISHCIEKKISLNQ